MSEQAAAPIRLAVSMLTLPDGRWVLQRRTKDAPIAAGKLGFFGGHIEAGEEPDAAIRRELAEETSLEVEALQIKFVEETFQPASRYDGKDILFYIYATAILADDFAVYEGEGAETYTVDELSTRDDLSEIVQKLVRQHASQN